jgi:diaminopimelate epimerase
MRFSKWHAHGNSYLVVETAELAPVEARRLCDPRVGIGSDGVLQVVRAEGDAVEVVIWNPDGSIAEFSGNGTRLAAAWRLAATGGDRVAVVTNGRRYDALRRADGRIEMAVGVVRAGPVETLRVEGSAIEFVPVDVGNPHAVLPRDPDREELLHLGPLVECSARFPGRTNVQLARADGPHDATALVWERGAGETSASGSSAVAVAAALVSLGRCESPVTVHMPGGDLEVAFDADGVARLAGPAVEICRGELL